MPSRIIKALDGKRGSFLFIGALAFMSVGLSYVAVEPTQSRVAGFSWLPWSPTQLGWLWIAAGLCALLGALLSKRVRWLEVMAFVALLVPPVAWSLIFAVAWVVGAHPKGWISVIVYALIAAWGLVVSDWPNPDEHVKDMARTGQMRRVPVPPPVERGDDASARDAE